MFCPSTSQAENDTKFRSKETGMNGCDWTQRDWTCHTS